MSWSFTKVGRAKLAAELKAAVQAESNCPQDIRDELCFRVDEQVRWAKPDDGIVVQSHGHMGNSGRTFGGTDTILIRVGPCPIVDTPLST